MAITALNVEQFAITFSARARQLAWLVGAGTSAAAGIPTAQDMILDFKTRLFCAATRLPRREIDPGDPLWRDRITAHFDDANGLPPAGHPSEYAVAFEAVYPDAADRRRYIDEAVKRGSPSFGHRVMAALIASRQLPCVFSTNFDPLIERATTVADEQLETADRVHLTVAAIDDAARAERCLAESDWPLLAKLHGDYQSVDLKNTSSELQQQDERLRRVVVSVAGRMGLLVVGYSGRDASVMATLGDAAVEGAFPAGLYWVNRPGTPLLPAVEAFLEAASGRGIETALVEAETFDQLGGAIDRQAQFPSVLAEHVQAARPAPRVVPVSIPSSEGGRFPALRCSAMPLLSIPPSARRLRLTKPMTTPEMRAALRDAGVRRVAVACQGQTAAVFGRDEEVVAALASAGASADGEIGVDPVADSWALGLLYDALARALSARRPVRPILRRSGHSLLLTEPDKTRDDGAARQDRARLAEIRKAYGSALTGMVTGQQLAYAEAVRVRLEHRLDRWWCVFEPYTWVDLPRRDQAGGSENAADSTQLLELAGDWRRERWARRYNTAWSDIIAAWAKLLAPDRETTLRSFGVPTGEGIDAEFVISQVTAWCGPSSASAWSPGD